MRKWFDVAPITASGSLAAAVQRRFETPASALGRRRLQPGVNPSSGWPITLDGEQRESAFYLAPSGFGNLALGLFFWFAPPGPQSSCFALEPGNTGLMSSLSHASICAPRRTAILLCSDLDRDFLMDVGPACAMGAWPTSNCQNGGN
jgi:hypothetical protein